jgi:dihydroorotase
MKARSKVDTSKFYSKAKWSPFEGFEVQGVPVYTIVRGNIVMEKGVVVSAKPVGEMVVPLRLPL